MTRREKWLQWTAQILGGGTMWGVWVAFTGIGPFAKEGFILKLLIASLALLVLLSLGAGMVLRARFLRMLGGMGKAFLSGALMGLAMAALLLLLAELMTALVGMMTLIGYGG